MYRALISFCNTTLNIRYHQILEDDFATEAEIADLLNANYIEEYDGSLEISENGVYDVEDYLTADVDVPSDEPTLQNKTITVTENGQQIISPDTGYDALSQVDLTVNVSSGGTYNAVIDTNVTTVFGTGYIVKIPELNTNNFTNINSWFTNYYKLNEIALFDTSKITSMMRTFQGCSSLTTVPLFNTENVTNMSYMFQGCSELVNVPQFNTSKVKDSSNMFYNCTKLVTVPLFDLSKVQAMNGMFSYCTRLANVPQFNLAEMQDIGNAFKECNALTNESLNNILAMCVSATSYTYTKTLVRLGLSAAQATICQGLSNYQAFLDAGWTTGY